MSQVTKHRHKAIHQDCDGIAVITVFCLERTSIVFCLKKDTSHGQNKVLSCALASSCSHRRMTRSNSVTTAVQADLDDPADVPVLPPRHCATMPRQHSRDAATPTVSIQGSGNHYHACAVDDLGEMGFDPSILPPPDPWMDSLPEPDTDPSDTTVRSVCPRDGRWFLKLLQAETERMEGWCRQMEQDETEHELPDESEFNPSIIIKITVQGNLVSYLVLHP